MCCICCADWRQWLPGNIWSWFSLPCFIATWHTSHYYAASCESILKLHIMALRVIKITVVIRYVGVGASSRILSLTYPMHYDAYFIFALCSERPSDFKNYYISVNHISKEKLDHGCGQTLSILSINPFKPARRQSCKSCGHLSKCV